MKQLKNNLKMRSFMQVALMIVLSGLAQVVSLAKSSVMATRFGTTVGIDAYNVIFNITLFLFSFAANGITTVLIPAFTRKTNKVVINTFLMTVYTGTIIISLLFIGLRYPVLRYFSNGNLTFISIANDIFLILLISQFFNTYVGVTTAYFQCIDRFNIPKVSTLITSLTLVLLLFINKHATVQYLAIITGLTTIANAAIQRGISFKYGMDITFKVDFSNSEYRHMLQIYAPTIFSAGLYQVNLLMDSLLSSKTGAGNVTILTYANSIIGMINSLIITNLLIYLYPKISVAVNESLNKAKQKLFTSTMLLSFFVCIMIVGFFSLGKVFLQILMLHGKFDNQSLILLYMCSCLYVIGLPFNVIRDIIYRFFYAIGDTQSTFINSVIASIINLVTSIILASFLGIYGVILGTLISSVVSMLMIIRKYYIKIGFSNSKKRYMQEFTWLFIPMLICSILSFCINSYISLGILSTIVLTVFTLSIYISVVLFSKGEIFKYVKSLVSRR
ncbi:lipid II flippase MurJ [Ligilactobacillus saerimneri]|uniref:murein biosynthesis integral membrane protein MurJ n=1 Tax=Ligilactobacillus saerimneri TaxID=228229 RepID=UPI002942FDFD|nr:lipid II flippase MurJ [Ligilactobacillus saerimneri]